MVPLPVAEFQTPVGPNLYKPCLENTCRILIPMESFPSVECGMIVGYHLMGSSRQHLILIYTDSGENSLEHLIGVGSISDNLV